MVLQQENTSSVEHVAAAPDGHLAARSIDRSRHRDGRAVNPDLQSNAAKIVAQTAYNPLDERYIWRKISAVFNQVADRIWHIHKDKIAAFDGFIVKPIEANRCACRAVVEQLFGE